MSRVGGGAIWDEGGMGLMAKVMVRRNADGREDIGVVRRAGPGTSCDREERQTRTRATCENWKEEGPSAAVLRGEIAGSRVTERGKGQPVR